MRTAEEIRAQQLLYNQSSLTSAVSGLPPSYIEGFKHTVDRFYRVTIGAGVTTVQGTRVEITADTFLRDADWLCVKTTDSGSFYYVYLTRTGLLKVDRTAPTYSGTYFYYQHPTFGYRSIGKLWASSAGNILWASSNFTAYSNQLTTAQTGYLGYADYYVDTDEDASIKFQMANDYLYGSFNGGANTILRGTYTIENTVTLNYGVTFRGEGEQTLINVNTVGTNGFEYGGATSFGCAIESCKIVNVETTAQDKYLIDFNGSPKGRVYNSILDYTKCAGILNDGSNNSIINNTMSGGKNNTFTYGSAYSFNEASTFYTAVASLSSSTFVVAYQDAGNSSYGTAVIGSISNDVITFGSETVFNSADTRGIAITKLTGLAFAIGYEDFGNSSHGTAVIGSVSGTSIAFGSETVFLASGTAYISTIRLTDTMCVFTYSAAAGTDNGKAIVGSVSGTAVAFGSEYEFNNADTFTISSARLTDTKFVTAYWDNSTAYGNAIIGTASGTSLAFGTEATYSTAYPNSNSVIRLTDTKFLIAFSDSGNSAYGTAIIGTVSGTAITYGNKYVFNAGDTEYISASRVSDTSCIISYQDVGNSGYSTIIGVKVYDNTPVFTQEYVFNSSNVTSLWVDSLDTTDFISVYRAGTGYGTGKVLHLETEICNAIESTSNNAIIQSNHIIADDTYVQEVGIYVSGDENIVANNQIDGISGSDRNIKVGLLVTSDSVRSQIVSNSVKNNLNYGFVNYGTNTSFAQNVAFNNGSDTGIANANQQNYLDAGTGTQISNNAWQSPVNTEPSVGTLHLVPVSVTTWDVLNNGTQISWTDVTCSHLVPVGTKAVLLSAWVYSVANTTGGCSYLTSFRKNGSTGTAEQGYVQSVGGYIAPAINATSYFVQGLVIVGLDSDRLFEYICDDTQNSARGCYIKLIGYYL